jgi:hypothetical protein
MVTRDDISTSSGSHKITAVNGFDRFASQPLGDLFHLPDTQRAERHISVPVICFGMISHHLTMSDKIESRPRHHCSSPSR